MLSLSFFAPVSQKDRMLRLQKSAGELTSGEQILRANLAFGQPQFHRWGFLCHAAAYPIMGEAVNIDDFDHHLGIVEIVFVPGLAVAAGCVQRALGKLQVAADLVEICIDAPEGAQG